MHDVRLAIRALRATPVLSIVATLSLALGIGANSAIFSLVNSLLLRTLPVAEPTRLVTISSETATRLGFTAGLGWNYPMWERLRDRSQAFDGAFAWSGQRVNLAQGGEIELADAVVTSGGFFTTLGVRARLGRLLTATDDVRGGGPDGPVAVISHDLWQRRFGGAPNAVGTPLFIERVPFTIVGVTPPEFLGVEVGRAFDVVLPLATEPLIRGPRASIDQRRSFTLFVMLRLKRGQSIEAATTALRLMQPELHDSLQLPKFVRELFTLMPAGAGIDMPTSVRPQYERALLTLLVVVALVLLIACANIANLLMARATARRHELSVRLALGAPRWRLARQMLVESLAFAGMGAILGLLFAVWGSRALVAQLSTSVNRVVLDLTLDWRVLAFTAAVTVVTAVLFGTAPALGAARIAPIEALKQQGRGATSGRSRLTSGLVVAQVALSLVLVVAAGLFVRSFERLASVPLGFDSDRVLLVTVDTARAHIDPAARLPFYHSLVRAIAAVPLVARAAGSVSTPVSGGLPRGVTVSGAPATSESERVVLANAVTPGWFATYGTAIRAGRDIDERDTADAPPVVIVNDAFVRRFFPGRGAIGEIVSARLVIGVVGDQVVQGGYKANGISRTRRDEAPPMIYVPLAQSAGSGPPDKTDLVFSVRSAAGSALQPARDVAAALTAVNPNLAFSIRPLSDDLHAALAQERMVATLSGFFGALAVLLAGLGLYGVTSYGVSRQRTEIGIRLALGAAPRGVVRLVLVRVSLLVGIGLVVGAGVSLWASTFVATLLYGLQPRDPITVAGAAVMLAATGALAGGIPAYRASRIDPAVVLRNN